MDPTTICSPLKASEMPKWSSGAPSAGLISAPVSNRRGLRRRARRHKLLRKTAIVTVSQSAGNDAVSVDIYG
jgi:hypothetical protein